MRLFWKAYDERFDPILVLVGLFFVLGGGWVLIRTGVSGPLILWVFRGIPAIIITIGAILLLREFQLWKNRRHSK